MMKPRNASNEISRSGGDEREGWLSGTSARRNGSRDFSTGIGGASKTVDMKPPAMAEAGRSVSQDKTEIRVDSEPFLRAQ